MFQIKDTTPTNPVRVLERLTLILWSVPAQEGHSCRMGGGRAGGATCLTLLYSREQGHSHSHSEADGSGAQGRPSVCPQQGLKERPTAGAQLASRPPGWRRWEHLENITHFDQSVFKSQTKPQRTQPGPPSQVEQHIWVFHWTSPLFAATASLGMAGASCDQRTHLPIFKFQKVA